MEALVGKIMGKRPTELMQARGLMQLARPTCDSPNNLTALRTSLV